MTPGPHLGPHLDRHRETAAAWADRYVLAAVPLSRQPIVAFLSSLTPEPRGATVAALGQRPTPAAEEAWLADLYRRAGRADAARPVTVHDLLAVDDPHLHMRTMATDRLVPATLLSESGFLTRNLGGWAPVLLDVFGLPAHPPADPVLDHVEALVEYGDEIDSVGADAHLVQQRLQIEIGGNADDAARMLVAAGDCRRGRTADEAVEELVRMLRRAQAGGSGPRVAPVVVYDALLSVLTATEDRRRQLLVAGDTEGAAAIVARQQRWRDDHGLIFILKGEYISGRHRRSTVLIAPRFGAVVKQPAPEPLHDIALAARTVDGRAENWPVPMGNGALVTPRGRLRMMLEDEAFPRLARAFDYPVRFCTLLGLHVEPYIAGATLQSAALADPTILTRDLYAEVVLHQQVCEVLGVDNADWHAANFMVRTTSAPAPDREAPRTLVHVDWAAARSLSDDERSDGRGAAARRRLDQVRNLAYSFHDERLAARTLTLHDELVGDPAALEGLRRRARAVVAGRGVTGA